jgi:hypothetical protein
MYYVPTYYYWLDSDNIYKNIKKELVTNLNRCRQKYIDKSYKELNVNNMIEKTNEYYEYKSALIRVILLEYAHNNSNSKGKDLLVDIINKWMNSQKISKNTKKYLQERTIVNITKYQKDINNIENILMLISLQILENFYI